MELPKFKPQTFEDRKVGALWLRFLREINGPLLFIPQEFQDNPDIAKAVELTQESSYTPEELEAYDEYLDAIRVEQTVREDSEQIGIAKGEQIGLEKTARKMLAKRMDIENVSELTGLSVEEIQSLG